MKIHKGSYNKFIRACNSKLIRRKSTEIINNIKPTTTINYPSTPSSNDVVQYFDWDDLICCRWSNHILSFFHQTKKNTNKIKFTASHESKIPVDVPKGHMVVYVGHENHHLNRYVISITLLNHPLFIALLDQARDEFGSPTATSKLCIPCDDSMFLDVLRCCSPTNRQYNKVFRFCQNWVLYNYERKPSTR